MENVFMYEVGMEVKNLASLPTGLRCNFLVCIKGHNGQFIAKKWKRKAPCTKKGEIVIAMTQTAYRQAL